MKPSSFEYVAAETIDEALGLLDLHGYDAKVLAGGQSLFPMMNFRVVNPGILIDINRLSELDFIAEDGSAVRIGGLTRHNQVKASPVIARRLPVLAAAAAHVAHLTVRNRGTFGGSLAHADPASEFPLIVLLLNATIVARSTSGIREIAARDLFYSYLTTSLSPNELVAEVRFKGFAPGTGWGFQEFSRRHGDFAVASVAATLAVDGGKCRDVRIAMGGVGSTPLRASSAERVLEGREPGDQTIAEAARAARDEADPSNDITASAEYRFHLIEVLLKRAVRDAVARATET